MNLGNFDLRPFALGAAVAIALEVGAVAVTGSHASHTSASPTPSTPTTAAPATSTTALRPTLTQPPIQTPTTKALAPAPAVTHAATAPATGASCTEMAAALPPRALSDGQAQDSSADIGICMDNRAAFQACLSLEIRARQSAVRSEEALYNNQWVSCEKSYGVVTTSP